MKSQVDPSSDRERSRGNSKVLGVRSQDSKVHKSKHREEESAEIKVYLSQLKELVPFMPKHKKLSRLEVIQYVIDYIQDLRQTLGLPPNSARNLSKSSMEFEDDSSLDILAMDSSSPSPLNVITMTAHSPRQPLGVISTPLNNGALSSCAASHEFPQILDKSPSADVDTRPVSC